MFSLAEVKRVLDCVHRFEYQVCLKTIYACGLRLLEGTRLRVKAIDSDRKMLHVVEGKGGKDRYVPLPDHTLMLLRHLWVTHRNPKWIFPSRNGLDAIDESAVQKVELRREFTQSVKRGSAKSTDASMFHGLAAKSRVKYLNEEF